MESIAAFLVWIYLGGIVVAVLVLRVRAGVGVWHGLRIFGPDSFGPVWAVTLVACSMAWPVALAGWAAAARSRGSCRREGPRAPASAGRCRVSRYTGDRDGTCRTMGSDIDAGDMWSRILGPRYPLATADPDGFCADLATRVLPAGGWAVHGAQRMVVELLGGDYRGHDFLQMQDAALEWLHTGGVPAAHLTGHEADRWAATRGPWGRS